MKKLAIVLLAGLVAISLLPGAATAGKKKKKGYKQEEAGSIVMMAPFPQDPNSCYSGLHRRIAIVSQEQVNGVVGYHFDVDPRTIGKPFVLEVTGGSADVDLDITFYTEFGTPEQATDTGYAPVNQSFEEREAGGESGIIPEGIEWGKAIVCMQNGQDASFEYTAGKGVKLPK